MSMFRGMISPISISVSDDGNGSSAPRVRDSDTFMNPMLHNSSGHHQDPHNKAKKKRNSPGNPHPDSVVIRLSPRTLMATDRFFCEVCNKGFQRDQNLQLHRRGHNLPWKLKQRSNNEMKRKRVYVCPEETCVHHDPSRALGDITGIKKHFCRKHGGEKKWKCDMCAKVYAVESDWKAHIKTCGTKEYRCDCGAVFMRKDHFTSHRAFCDALAEESARPPVAAASNSILPSPPNPNTTSPPPPPPSSSSFFPFSSLHDYPNTTVPPPPPPSLSSSFFPFSSLHHDYPNTAAPPPPPPSSSSSFFPLSSLHHDYPNTTAPPPPPPSSSSSFFPLSSLHHDYPNTTAPPPPPPSSSPFFSFSSLHRDYPNTWKPLPLMNPHNSRAEDEPYIPQLSLYHENRPASPMTFSSVGHNEMNNLMPPPLSATTLLQKAASIGAAVGQGNSSCMAHLGMQPWAHESIGADMGHVGSSSMGHIDMQPWEQKSTNDGFTRDFMGLTDNFNCVGVGGGSGSGSSSGIRGSNGANVGEMMPLEPSLYDHDHYSFMEPHQPVFRFSNPDWENR